MNALERARLALLVISALYALFLACLLTPYFQAHAIFLHKIQWPLFADLSDPVRYGLPASRSTNVRITTSDNISLGAWLLLPPSTSSSFHNPPANSTISDSLRTRPTVLFFHGNAANRAAAFRVQHCLRYAASFDANVLAIDYRGFGDSDGTPSQDGLVKDARAAWEWVRERGAKEEDVLLVGLSLGTGVVSGLAAELAREGTRPKGIVLIAPFTSIKDLLLDYSLFGLVPILQPLGMFPPLQNFLMKFLKIDFETKVLLPTINAPILLAHSLDDTEIPHSHSHSLFNLFVDPLLPPSPSPPESAADVLANDFDWDAFKNANEERQKKRSELVLDEPVEGFGTVFRLDRSWEKNGDVMLVESRYGGHNGIGLQESLVDVMAEVFFKPKSP